MQLSKHSHSCLLIKDKQGVILIDPGVYTEQDNSLDLDSLPALDALLITHNHADHFSPYLIKKALQKFPNVAIITNDATRIVLEKEGIPVAETGHTGISFSSALHEKLPMPLTPPENTLFTVFDKLTHPGDSFDFSQSKDILALPVTAPWGSTTKAVEKALEVRPKIIIPIHDWHWKDEARKQFYIMLQKTFANEGIEFIPLENNEVIDL